VAGAAVTNIEIRELADRVAKLETRCTWLEEYASTLESALMKALPPWPAFHPGSRRGLPAVRCDGRVGVAA
jgi:hypothetical protein